VLGQRQMEPEEGWRQRRMEPEAVELLRRGTSVQPPRRQTEAARSEVVPFIEQHVNERASHFDGVTQGARVITLCEDPPAALVYAIDGARNADA
jgi:hypothetical protein